MEPHQIESKVLNIIQRVEAGQPIEDSTVELKSEWIAPEQAIRILAGHANSARGAQILWVIGIDEKAHKVVGASDEELSDWYGKIKTGFDGLAPQLFSQCIPARDKTVVALLFDTNRAPFVIKNPVFGKSGGGSVQFEVPWRENNSTHSARRDELLMLLSPLQVIPRFEVLDGYFQIRKRIDILECYLSLTLYAETTSQEIVVIPFHKAKVKFNIPNTVSSQPLTDLHLNPPYSGWGGIGATSKSLSLTIEATEDEVLIHGPGKVILTARFETSSIFTDKNLEGEKVMQINIDLLPIGIEHYINISIRLEQTSSNDDDNSTYTKFKWVVPPLEGNI